MANSKLTITFNKSFTVNQTFVYFYIGIYGSAYPTNRTTISKYWNNLPLNNANEIPITNPTAIIGESEAIGFVTSLVGVSEITVTRFQNVVTIESTNTNKYFVYGGAGYPNSRGLGQSIVSNLVANVKPNGLILNSVTLTVANADFCQKAKATITTNKLSPVVLEIFRNVVTNYTLTDALAKLTNKAIRFETGITSGVSTNKILFLTGGYLDFMVVGNSFIVEATPNPANNKKYTIKNITVASGVYTLTVNESVTPTLGTTLATIDYSDYIALSIPAVAFLNPNDFSIAVIQSPDNNISLTVEKSTFDDLEIEYSLDGIDWQTSNNFSSLSVGDYTMYVRDGLGCSFEKTFTVSDFGGGLPYFYISKSNSIRFANRIAFGDSENYKNDENTLSYEVDCKIPYTEIQKFQSADVITTQFKSNYTTNTATIVKKDNTTINVPVVQKTNFRNLKSKLDARMYDLGGGKTGIYFTSGKTYDYDTNTDLSEDHFLNGTVPQWAVFGNYINVNSDWHLIEEVVYDEIKNADVIVFSDTYSGSDIAVLVSSIYNLFNYDVFEFTIDMVNYIDQYFQVRINNTHPNFTELVHLSEWIWCKVKHDKVLEIRYRNSGNTDMFYATGITNLIRVEYQKINGKLDEESETYKTDTNSVLLSAELYEVDEIVFEPITKEIWRKLTQALSHEMVTINGVGYVKNGSFNTEGPLEDSNLHVLTATMIKTGSVYNSQSSGNNDFNTSSVEVPGLIETDSGYVKY